MQPPSGADGATSQPGSNLNFIGGFGPGGMSEAPTSPSDPAVEATPVVAAEPVAAAEPEPEKPTRLAELIATQRADRQAKAQAEAHARTVADENAALKAKLAQVTTKDVVADPIGWADAHGLTREERVHLGQSLLYDIVPEKAPPNWRIDQFEAKQARQARLDAAKQAESASQAEQQATAAQISQYTETLKTVAATADEQALPESVAWFGGNHDEYTQSLFATANNMAQAAGARGEVADLSPKTVAAVLEAEIKARLARRKGTAASAPAQQTAPVAGGKQPTVADMSTHGLSGGGAPRPKAITERERLERAMAVAFRTK